MVPIDDLKEILLLEKLTDAMLEKMIPVTQVRHYEEGEVIFEEGQKAEFFYMLKRGKVLLEVELSDTITISLGAIKSGYSFGWSALLNDAAYITYAVCVEPCEVLVIPGDRFVDILRNDHTMGYLVMEYAYQILMRRLGRRTGQFLKVMRKHPDIQKLLGLEE